MRRAGRDVRLFPQEPYDAWRGTGREIANRLVQLIDWADEGGGAYYRDLSINLVRLACGARADRRAARPSSSRASTRPRSGPSGPVMPERVRSSASATSTSTPAASATARS